MNRHSQEIERILSLRGPTPASELAGALGVTQPTISRAIGRISRKRIARLGSGRSTRYAMRLEIEPAESAWPLYSIDRDGHPLQVGTICALRPDRWYLDQDEQWDTLRGSEFADGLFPGLPWFIHDMRPQGFMGRIFARLHAQSLGCTVDTRTWSDGDNFRALLNFGADLPGSFVIGDRMLAELQRRRQRPAHIINAERPENVYSALADSILEDDLPGSSAAGEQPKFTACVRDAGGKVRHTIVKFSARPERAEDERWSDLLVAEHIANEALRTMGLRCAETRIMRSGGRTLLESIRFDRIGTDGRLGMVSLEALDSAFFGALNTPWTKAADRLLDDGWINPEDAEDLRTLWWFGTLIGNTDMHYGNISLHLTPSRPLQLAPAYDMVPMLYRPGLEGHLPEAAINPPPPAPASAHIWRKAAEGALRFWERVTGAADLSESFKDIAGRNAEIVSTHIRTFG